MIQMCDLNDRPAKAGDLTSELLAAYETFDIILLAIRGRQDPGTCMFTALVRSASCAVDGRDALRRAPSLPLSAISPPIITRRAGAREPGIRDLAQDLSALATQLTGRLIDAERLACSAGDREACSQAEECAREIRELLAGYFR